MSRHRDAIRCAPADASACAAGCVPSPIAARARRHAGGDAGGDPRTSSARPTLQHGKVTLDMPPLVENGNAVPLTVTVESPMTDGRSRQGDPRLQREEPAAACHHASRSGRAPAGRSVSTRIRLADSQQVDRDRRDERRHRSGATAPT